MLKILQHLSETDRASLLSSASALAVPAGQRIFSSGDAAGHIYFIRRGRVAVLLDQFNSEVEINQLGSGEFFGEIGVLRDTPRAANVVAVEPTELLRLEKHQFHTLVGNDPSLAARIERIIGLRTHELALQESLAHSARIHRHRLHVSIKGDPSLRETAFVRERHESVVDRVLDALAPRLEELLLERAVFSLSLGFNNGEVQTASVFDPFRVELHPALKLVDAAYVDRHFARIGYGAKVEMIRRVYALISSDPSFSGIPPTLQSLYRDSLGGWQPLAADEIRRVIGELPSLRRIEMFYLRSVTISTVQDVIRLQFNCDGTHILGSEDYHRFIDENVEAGTGL